MSHLYNISSSYITCCCATSCPVTNTQHYAPQAALSQQQHVTRVTRSSCSLIGAKQHKESRWHAFRNTQCKLSLKLPCVMAQAQLIAHEPGWPTVAMTCVESQPDPGSRLESATSCPLSNSDAKRDAGCNLLTPASSMKLLAQTSCTETACIGCGVDTYNYQHLHKVCVASLVTTTTTSRVIITCRAATQHAF